MITMDSKAQLTVDIVAKVAEGKIDIVNAAKLLSKSRRTLERYLKKYQKLGIQFVVHQNTGKSPPNRSCDALLPAQQPSHQPETGMIYPRFLDFYVDSLVVDRRNDNNKRLRETFNPLNY